MELKDTILEQYTKGNIVFAGVEGVQVAPLPNFIKQPADGILYDLNRLESVVLGFLDDPKWINDYAVAKTIRALKQRIEELEQTALESWLKIREESKDEQGDKLCYCGHTFKCSCAHPDLKTFEESVKNGTIILTCKNNGWENLK